MNVMEKVKNTYLETANIAKEKAKLDKEKAELDKKKAQLDKDKAQLDKLKSAIALCQTLGQAVPDSLKARAASLMKELCDY